MSMAIDNHKHLKAQIEYIRDMGDGDVHDVIVRMSQSDDVNTTIMTTVADALRRRGLSNSARDVLPVSASAFDETVENLRTSSRRSKAAKTANDSRSLAAQLASEALQSVAVPLLRSAGLQALAPLVESSAVREAIIKIADQVGKKSKRNQVPELPIRQFWASDSAVMRVNGADLITMINEVGGIADIYPNRQLLLPPVVTPQRTPSAVEDIKASSWGLNKIGALAAWGAYGARGEGVTIGLLDTGVDADHPDLKGKIAAWAEFDRDGYEVPDSRPYDSDQHGTHCAGTIVGGNAGGRWIGVAPAAKIAAALVLKGKQGGTDAQVLAGMQWAIEQGVDVISMSLGGLVMGPDVPTTYTRTILNALQVGVPVVTAIGNEGSQTSGSPGNDFLSFAVGATDHLDRAAGFSGGRTQVIRQSQVVPPNQLPLVYSKPDISAPGVVVHSTVPGGKYQAFNGTSMATPHVAGAIALLLSATLIKEKVEPAKRAFVIQDLLTGAAEELGEAGQNHRYGFGRLDVLRAVGFARDLGYGP